MIKIALDRWLRKRRFPLFLCEIAIAQPNSKLNEKRKCVTQVYQTSKPAWSQLFKCTWSCVWLKPRHVKHAACKVTMVNVVCLCLWQLLPLDKYSIFTWCNFFSPQCKGIYFSFTIAKMSVHNFIHTFTVCSYVTVHCGVKNRKRNNKK